MVLGGSCMVGWDNCCRGASTGGPLWHRSKLLWGLGRLVARHWLVDDGLCGSPFGLVGSEGGGRRMHG